MNKIYSTWKILVEFTLNFNPGSAAFPIQMNIVSSYNFMVSSVLDDNNLSFSRNVQIPVFSNLMRFSW